MRTIWAALAALWLAAAPAAAVEDPTDPGLPVPTTVPELPLTVDDLLDDPVTTTVVEVPVVLPDLPSIDLDAPVPSLDPSLGGDGGSGAGTPSVAPPSDGPASAPGAGHLPDRRPPTAIADPPAPSTPDGAVTEPVPAGRAHDRPFGTVIATAARPFAAPLLLAVALVLFAAGHGWSDRRDPRLAEAPVDDRDEHLRFS